MADVFYGDRSSYLWSKHLDRDIVGCAVILVAAILNIVFATIRLIGTNFRLHRSIVARRTSFELGESPPFVARKTSTECFYDEGGDFGQCFTLPD